MGALATLKDDLTKIFNNFSSGEGLVSEIASRGFVWSELETKKVVFVGINPSFLTGEKPATFSFNPLNADNRHFKDFQDLAEQCNIAQNWTYLDILYLREKDQNSVLELLKSETGLDFIIQQLQISINVLEELNPELIIVCNGGARRFFGKDRQVEKGKESGIWMGYDFEFDERFGVDIITGMHHQSIKKGIPTTCLIGTPVLFSGTLKYMENSTKDRLVWQIKRILKFMDLYFGNDNHITNSSDRVLNQFQKLTNELALIRATKNTSVSNNQYERTVHLRDYELAHIEKLVELLLIELI